jgi:hypothetical protein
MITRLSIGSDKNAPFSFLGIVASEPDYTISLRINKKTGIALRHSDEEIIAVSGNERISFSLFITPDSNNALVSNRSEKKFLINKLNKIDFLFISRPSSNSTTGDLAKIIRSIEGVTAVFILNSAEVKDKNLDLISHLTY